MNICRRRVREKKIKKTWKKEDVRQPVHHLLLLLRSPFLPHFFPMYPKYIFPNPIPLQVCYASFFFMMTMTTVTA